MKSIFNWTFGSIFRTFGRIIAYLSVGLLLGFILSKTGLKLPDLLPIMKVSASTINSYSVYNGYSTISGCGDSGKYNYDTLGPNAQGSVYYNIGSVGSTISGQAKNMVFGFKYDLEANKTYDLTITFKSKDLTNKLSSSKIFVYNGANCGEMTNNNVAILSVTNKASSGSNTNKIKIRLYSNILISNWVLELRGGNTNFTSVNNFGISSFDLVEVDTSNNKEVIENNNQNTDNIINNQNENTQDVINNNNQNTQDIINNQNELLGSKCENLVDLSGFNTNTLNGVTFTNNNDGTITINGTATNSFGITFFRPTLTSGNYTFNSATINAYIYDYSSNTSILTNGETNKKINGTYNNIGLDTWINSGQVFNNVIFKPMITKTSSVKSFCKYGTYTSKQDTTNQELNNLNNSINDDDSSGAQSEASDFFSNFTTNTHGLTGIITAPLNAIQSLTSKSCSPLVLPLPFVNQNLTLPCMREIYVQNFGSFMNIYDVITLGIISYWIMVRIFALVKDFKNPDHDEIEVMDL